MQVANYTYTWIEAAAFLFLRFRIGTREPSARMWLKYAIESGAHNFPILRAIAPPHEKCPNTYQNNLQVIADRDNGTAQLLTKGTRSSRFRRTFRLGLNQYFYVIGRTLLPSMHALDPLLLWKVLFEAT
jgi:hypothetical protein